VKMSEFQGFTPGCKHELALLPVIDFGHTYRCRKCGGLTRVQWTAETAGMNLEQLAELARSQVKAAESTEIPGTVQRMKRDTVEEFAALADRTEEFHVVQAVKDKVRDMLGEAFTLGYEQASADSCGCV
jgi:hypothetical protein